MFTRPFKRRGRLSHVFLPMMTAFLMLGRCVVVVTALNLAKSADKAAHGNPFVALSPITPALVCATTSENRDSGAVFSNEHVS
jgi:hypothetical protein